MHTVTAQFAIVPGKEAEALAAIETLVAAVQESEPGALTYTWHRDVKDPSQVFVFEVYRDDEAVAAHHAGPHLADFQKHFGPNGAFDPASVKIARFTRIAEVTR